MSGRTMNRADALKYLEIEQDDLPKTLEEAEAELDEAITIVADIRQQLEDERAGITHRTATDPTWATRAQVAAKKQQIYVNLIKRDRNGFRSNERQNELLLANQEYLDGQKRHAEKQAQHAERMRGEREALKSVVFKWLDTLPAELRQDFTNEVREAELTFRQSRPDLYPGSAEGRRSPGTATNTIKEKNMMQRRGTALGGEL